ncbi:TetR/AcrR family transcriptional regulator [Pseudomonas sp. Au-Pse12]|uniref:TetR/AcrR family transcriptional regulator n=1 Tax=Pseudomonas sp. Au-Pse12 TaxID=2906459 RepID=UPI001E39BB73|nr:TetR/AcrR family transcriptional regulator [Pseudomonas sp. Au-Pse12]MCE4053859.1 TetR/AcrR family transcriptional regulator [Pseudomonas sp. Au-Pse12]
MSRQFRWGDASRMDSANEGRTLILRSALDAMIEQGVDGFSIDDVAQRANISRRTLYRYYGGKKELIQAVINAENGAFFDEMRRSLREFEEDFEAYLEECVCFSVRYRDRHHGGFHHNYLARNVTSEVFSYILENIAPMWNNVLEGPYRRDVDLYGPSPATLENIIALISRIGLAYCLVPAEESEIRAQMRMLRHFHRVPR